MHDGKGKKIRLYGIDTPEKRQAFDVSAETITLVSLVVIIIYPFDTVKTN